MIDRKHDLPITRQAEVLRVGRGSVYYLPRPVSATDLEVMVPPITWSSHLPVRGCCEAGWWPRRARSAVVTSKL